MTPRALDEHGHRWPITGTVCATCSMPMLGAGEAHPLCSDPFTPEEHANAEALPQTTTDRWLISGQPVDTVAFTSNTAPDGTRLCVDCALPLPRTAGPGVIRHLDCWKSRKAGHAA